MIQGVHSPRQCLLWSVMLATGVLAPALVSAQDICPDHGNAGTHVAQLFLSRTDGSCTVANGGYVKTSNTSYEVHIAINVTGSCQVMVLSCSGLPPKCSCVEASPQVRNIQATKLYDSHQSTYFAVVQPVNQSVQVLDTRPPTGTTNTGSGWLFGAYEEAHSLTSSTNWNPTSCNHQPTVFAQDEALVVNAVKCEPKFDSANEHLPPNVTTSIYLPPSMEAAAGDLGGAVTSWNAALVGTGVHLEVVRTPCSSNCIEVQVDPSLRFCGFAHKTVVDPATGVVTAGLISLRPEWVSYSPDGLQRTLVHEVGHFLGLDNYNAAACGVADAAMQDQFNCADPTVMHEPTFSDTRPVENSTYGGKPKVSCGF